MYFLDEKVIANAPIIFSTPLDTLLSGNSFALLTLLWPLVCQNDDIAALPTLGFCDRQSLTFASSCSLDGYVSFIMFLVLSKSMLLFLTSSGSATQYVV